GAPLAPPFPGASLPPCELLAHLDEQLHARQADAFSLRQFLDHLDARDVALGIARRFARRALWRGEAPAFIHPRGLRIYARELGRHADDVDGPLLRTIGPPFGPATGCLAH